MRNTFGILPIIGALLVSAWLVYCQIIIISYKNLLTVTADNTYYKVANCAVTEYAIIIYCHSMYFQCSFICLCVTKQVISPRHQN